VSDRRAGDTRCRGALQRGKDSGYSRPAAGTRWPAPARRIRARFRSVATSIKEGRIPAMSPRSGARRWNMLASSCAENPHSLPASGHYPTKGEGFRLCRLDPGPDAGTCWPAPARSIRARFRPVATSIKGGRIPAMPPRSEGQTLERWPAPARRIRARFRPVATSIKGGRIPAMPPRSKGQTLERWPAPARRIRARFRPVATSIKGGGIPAMSPRSGSQTLGKGEGFRLPSRVEWLTRHLHPNFAPAKMW
jgi:hypothetical protein